MSEYTGSGYPTEGGSSDKKFRENERAQEAVLELGIHCTNAQFAEVMSGCKERGIPVVRVGSVEEFARIKVTEGSGFNPNALYYVQEAENVHIRHTPAAASGIVLRQKGIG